MLQRIFYIFTILVFGSLTIETSTEERKWLDVNFEKKWSTNITKYQVYRLGRGFYVDDSHQIYISSLSDKTIKMFNEHGNFIRAFGKEKGAGPGEVRHPLGFDVDEEGNVWIADDANARITIFQNDGSFFRHIPVEVIPYRIAVSNNGEYFYIINRGSSPYGKFTKFSDSGEILKRFGSGIIKNQMKISIVLSGEIATGMNGNLYYAPDYAGLLMGFDEQGKVLFKTETVVYTPFPEVRFNAAGGSWVDREAERVSRQIFTDDKGRVCILSFASVSPKIDQALDFYSQSTGKYLYSMKLPGLAFQVYLKDDTLFIVRYSGSNVTLSAWHVNIYPKNPI